MVDPMNTDSITHQPGEVFLPRHANCILSIKHLINVHTTPRGFAMQEKQLRRLIEDVREGKLPRRGFIQQMVGLGLTAPMASMMLMNAGIAQAQTAVPYKPTKRGGGGMLKVIYWQAAVHLNPHYAGGTKDQDASRIFYEPLAGWDSDGNMIPILAARCPRAPTAAWPPMAAASCGSSSAA